ncbi:HyaD/HybD family hydrogenase maturation endopeptidase [Campylobacter majalis]|uniref:HyaD/HybD family hydrogenase maturation endopeptidase n=1 Tax=Campylobacter majalis TaxID=2790656 RepID=UPI003D691040
MRVLVLGIGNVMFGDEGVGVHIVNALSRSYAFTCDKHSIEFVDGGTLAIALTPIISSFDYLIVVDCISADDSDVGDVYFFDIDNMPKKIRWDGSAHEVEMLQTLELMVLCGDRPNGKILGIIPSRVEPTTFELSKEVQKGALIAEKTILSHLSELGFVCEKIGNFSVLDMANEYASKGLK